MKERLFFKEQRTKLFSSVEQEYAFEQLNKYVLDLEGYQIMVDELEYGEDPEEAILNLFLASETGFTWDIMIYTDGNIYMDGAPIQDSQDLEEEIREKAKLVIERVELNNAINKLPSEISGGMQKRVAIARAIVMNPKYLFCDEPNSGLDPKTAIVIDKLIHEITKEYNITTIINSHDMNSVIEIGEKIIFLLSGEKNWEGTNTEILKTNVKSVKNFVYSSELLKKVKKYL